MAAGDPIHPYTEVETLPHYSIGNQAIKYQNTIGDAGDQKESPSWEQNPLNLYNDNQEFPRKEKYVQKMLPGCKIWADSRQYITQNLKLCSRHYHLWLNQKADYFLHILDGAVRKVYFRNWSDNMNHAETLKVMASEYIRNYRQLTSQKYIWIAEIEILCEKKRNISDLFEGLKKIVDKVFKLGPQLPTNFRTVTNTIDYPRNSFTKFQNWSCILIQNLYSEVN